MTAFSTRHTELIENSISSLKWRMLQNHHLEMEHDEFLALFAGPEDRRILRQATEIAQISSQDRIFHGEISHIIIAQATGESTATLSFDLTSTKKSKAPLCPYNTKVVPDADPIVVERITSWVTQRIEVGYQFSRARNLFAWLNTHCPSKDTVRFFWPTVIALLNEHEDGKELANKLREVKPPRSAPHMPHEVAEACRSTAGTIACATLMPPPQHRKINPPVRVDLSSVAAQKREGALGYLTPV